MSDILNRSEDDIPVHRSPVLYFARCGCTYYHTTPHQIPQDDQNPPAKPCREMVLDIDNIKRLKTIQKLYIEGNCRIHDIEMVQHILATEHRPGDNPDEYCSETDLIHLRMVRSKTAAKYRAFGHFNVKWRMQLRDWHDLTARLDRRFQHKIGDKLTKEEMQRLASIIGSMGN